MSRYRKGTLDHDSNGKKGGSRKKAAAPKSVTTAPREPALQMVFEQGRTARLSGISREDSPHGAGPQCDAWRDGWDAADHG